MDHIEHAFAALSDRMSHLSMPDRAIPEPQSLVSLIDKVNRAKRLYEPGRLRR